MAEGREVGHLIPSFINHPKYSTALTKLLCSTEKETEGSGREIPIALSKSWKKYSK